MPSLTQLYQHPDLQDLPFAALQDLVQAIGEDRGSDRPHRNPRPSPLIARAAKHGLKRWQVSHGLPRRLADLARLERWLEAQEALLPAEPDDIPGYWHLDLRQGTHMLPARMSLSILDAGGGRLEHLLFAIAHQHAGAPKDAVLALAARIHSTLAHRRLTALFAWAKPHGLWLHGWTPSALLWLARQPEDLRWALLHNRPARGLADLNWTAFSHAKTSTPARLSYLPPKVLWARMLGLSAPDTLALEGLALPNLTGFKFGTLRRLCLEFAGDRVDLAEPRKARVQGWLPAFINLVRLFADYAAIRRFVTQTQSWSLRGIHDAGQFRLPAAADSWTPARWAPLCQRHPAAVREAQHFARLDTAGVLPSSLSSLHREILRQDYPNIPARWRALAEQCLHARLSAREFEEHQQFWAKVTPKPADFMPYVRLEGASWRLPGWRLIKLTDSDYRGPLLGALTGCCQHLGGAGRACAQHGITSPFSAFYVVERNGKVVAQSWAWRNTHGGLVFDSVEALDRTPEVIAATAQLLHAAAPQLLAKSLGITSLFIGETLSGITGEVAQQLTLAGEMYETLPADECDYYDGQKHRLWSGTAGRKQKLPAIAGYTPRKAIKPPPGATREDWVFCDIEDAREFQGHPADPRRLLWAACRWGL